MTEDDGKCLEMQAQWKANVFLGLSKVERASLNMF